MPRHPLLAPRPAAAAAAAPDADPRLATLAAMQAELGRSMERLRLRGYEAPYFLSYQVEDVTRIDVEGRYGALFDDSSRRDRNLLVDVRVGSYALDSSAPEEPVMILGGEEPSWYAPREAPLDGDADALRAALWLATDERYKDALSTWFKKRAREVNREEDPERPPSFSRETPERHVDPPLSFPFDAARWRRTARETSALFRAHPAVFDSSVKVMAERQVRWFASSEGTAVVTERTLYGVHLEAVARAPDGQLLENGRDFYAPTEAELPSAEALRPRRSGSSRGARGAPGARPPSTRTPGPPSSSRRRPASSSTRRSGHRLEGERLDDDKEGQTYKGQVGQPILPPFLSIVDDPTLARAGGVRAERLLPLRRAGRAGPAHRARARREARELSPLAQAGAPLRALERARARSQGARAPIARMANLVVESRAR